MQNSRFHVTFYISTPAASSAYIHPLLTQVLFGRSKGSKLSVLLQDAATANDADLTGLLMSVMIK